MKVACLPLKVISAYCQAPTLQRICNIHRLQAYKALDSAREEIDRNLLELAALLRLKELDISKDPAFPNTDCRTLAKMTSLETLHVDSNPISCSGFEVTYTVALHPFPSVELLGLSPRMCCLSN